MVFDLDGVLALTEPLKARAHARAIEELGGRLDGEAYARHMGSPHEAASRAFLREAGLETADPAAHRERFARQYRRLLGEGLAAAPGASEAVRLCRERGWAVGVVTSSHAWMAERVLGDLGLRPLLDVLVTADDVARHKPDPAPYRAAAAALGCSERPCVAVEDTDPGVASASGAGLPVIGVRHGLNRRHQFRAAAAVVEGLAPADAFLRLAARTAALAD